VTRPPASRTLAGLVGALALAASGWLAGTAAAASPEFGISTFAMTATNQAGEPFTQAGGVPYELTTTLDLTTEELDEGSGEARISSVQEPKDMGTILPQGMVANPQAIPRCQLAVLTIGRPCPPASQVGTIVVKKNSNEYQLSGLYNVSLPAARPGELGFIQNGIPYLINISVHTGEGYRVTAIGENLPIKSPIIGFEATLWGVPADPSHTPQRGLNCFGFETHAALEKRCQEEIEFGYSGNEPSGAPPVPFVRMPTDCAAGALEVRGEVESWENPGVFVSKSSSLPPLTGCSQLVFDPTLSVKPETTEADTPDGLLVNVAVPQSENPTSALRDTVVTLPPGMSVTPAAADGLQSCSAAQFAENSQSVATCPEASQIGTVEMTTPLLASPLVGQIFVGEPLCGEASDPVACGPGDSEEGRLLRLFLQAQGSGTLVKLVGRVEIGAGGPHTAGLALGQIRTVFEEDPEFAFSDLKVMLKGGPRAPIASPQTCGAALSTSTLTPWGASGLTPEGVQAAGLAEISPVSLFEVTGCASAAPFHPGFVAGAAIPVAGAFSPFTLSLSREDREQNLGGMSVTLPPGVLGLLSKVTPCPEPQASQGACGPQSRIGTATTALGAGSHPFWTSGAVYLTGAYGGAPYGLSILVPAKVGPFNLGYVIVRAKIGLDAHTAQVSVVSDALPQSIAGIPLRLKAVNVTIDREGFIVNPTNCSALAVAGTAQGVLPSGAAGSTAPISSPFAVGGCANLPFHPSFSVSTHAKVSETNGIGLDVKVASVAGQANIAGITTSLPEQLPARLTTLQQACLQATFAHNPASCPPASNIGIATVVTPALRSPVSGPAYLVSHGNAAFPDLVLILQGEGVTMQSTGTISIRHGVTSSSFVGLPDVPIGSFDLTLPAGPHSALSAVLPSKAKGSLCGQHLLMPTKLTGQNGAVVEQNARIAVSGCAKPKPKPKKTKHKKTKKHKGKAARRRR
jgi:hypothetical protein